MLKQRPDVHLLPVGCAANSSGALRVKAVAATLKAKELNPRHKLRESYH